MAEESPALNTDTFEFKGLIPERFSDIVLSNIERSQLRALADEGGPLWRIMQGLLGWRQIVSRGLEVVDLYSEDGRRQAGALQAEIKAITWQYDLWQRLLTFIPAEPIEDEGS